MSRSMKRTRCTPNLTAALEGLQNIASALCNNIRLWQNKKTTLWPLTQSHHTCSIHRVHDPKSWLCQQAEELAENGFKGYASPACSPERRAILKFFQITKPRALHGADRDQNTEFEWNGIIKAATLPGYPVIVTRNLYRALSKYVRCKCKATSDLKGPPLQHETRLCLKSRYDLSDDLATFDMHFHRLPVLHPGEANGFWQELRLRVPCNEDQTSIVQHTESSIQNTEATSKRVRFALAESLSPNLVEPRKAAKDFANRDMTEEAIVDNGVKEEDSIGEDGICRILQVDNGPVRVRLRVGNGYLYHDNTIKDGDPPEQILEDGSSISLATVLTDYNLSTKMKLTLGYILAHSMWQYYDSDWMNTPWSTESIQFMQESHHVSSKGTVITCRPCFSVRFGNQEEAVPDYSHLPHLSHRYPRVLSLGSLLVQIGWNHDGDQEYPVRYAISTQRINHESALGTQAKKDTDWPRFNRRDTAADGLRGLYRKAAMACFERSSFKPRCKRCDSIHWETCSDCIKLRRKMLQEKVVLPLYRALCDSGWEESLDKPDVIPLKSSNTRRGILSRTDSSGDGNFEKSEEGPHFGQQSEILKAAKYYHDVPSNLSRDALKTKCRDYGRWRDCLKSIALPYELKELKEPHRVKIAVLDSGLDKTHRDIKTWWKRIQVFDNSSKTFGNFRDTNIEDANGHGTFIAGLVLEYTRDACLYVANVAENGAPNCTLLAQAIESAANIDVDIISISIGFDRKPRSDALEKAIRHAQGRNVLIFASASNNGGNGIRTWPANYERIFCIYSTDTDGNKSGFNPTERKDYDFSTVGEAVVSIWPDNHSLTEYEEMEGVLAMVKFGTSFSTPLAACIAAFLLRYARTTLDSADSARLKYDHVMRSVLKHLARNVKRDGFYYLTLRSDAEHLFDRTKKAAEIKEELEEVIRKA